MAVLGPVLVQACGGRGNIDLNVKLDPLDKRTEQEPAVGTVPVISVLGTAGGSQQI